MTKYIYSMAFTAQKLADIIEQAIGRRPEGIGASGNRGMSFTFKDTDITPAERQTALAALPDFVKDVYSFKRTTAPDDEA